MRILQMRTAIALLVTALLAACASPGSRPEPKPLAIAPAPISYDGHVAGQATDYIFVLERNVDPAVPGHTLSAGDTLAIRLPKDFKRNAAAPLAEDADRNLVLVKGWPQGAVRQKDQYRIFFDPATNDVGVRALVDVGREGANAPGIKVMHLRGQTFINPGPGEYPVEVAQRAADGAIKAVWSGTATVLLDAPRARLAPMNFHLPPGTNSDFQKFGVGRAAPHWLGLMLWTEPGSPLNSVGIAPRDLNRFPKYTGGLLVQDTNNDGKLEPAVDRVVGGIIGAAPEGARGQSAASPRGGDGRLVLSGAVLRDPKFPGGGKPNPGLLPIQFTAGDKPGLYRPTFELIGGNSYQFTLIAE
jgi:hypothetical protein